MHSQTCPSIAKSAIEVIPRKRNVKIRGKPETKIWNLLCFGIRNPAPGIQNPAPGIRNPQRGIQNLILSWITLHGATPAENRVKP